MTIRAKFYVSSLQSPEGATAAQVNLNAVCRGVENSLWSQATPCGSIQMTVKNTAAFEQFEQGAEYEVVFRKVSKPAPGDGHPIVEATNMYGVIVCETCGATVGVTQQAIDHRYVSATAQPGLIEENVQAHHRIYGSR